MKKFFLMTLAAVMAATTMSAQNKYYAHQHEVAVAGGILSNSQWIDFYEDITVAMFTGRMEDKKYFGPLSAEYFYHTNSWLGVGGIFAYGHSKQDVTAAGDVIGKHTNNYFTLMPAVKFDWLRKENFGLYSKLAVGATLRNEKVDFNDPADQDGSDTALHINWQASFLGIELGSPTIRAFAEAGFGEQGVLLAGVRCKF